jgi:membrane-bound lytic murein transglycosylase MltF
MREINRTRPAALGLLLLLITGCGAKQGTAGTPEQSAEGLPHRVLERMESRTGDFPEMAERSIIRVLTSFNRTHYFLDGGVPRGAVVETLREFEQFVNEGRNATRTGIRVITVPVARDQLLQALVDGKGDIAVANLTITPARLELVDFSRPIIEGVEELVVTGPSAPDVGTLEDLAGKEIFVRRSSSHYESLQQLNARLAEEGLDPVDIQEANELLETEDLLEMVNAGIYPMTVADSTLADFWEEILEDIVVRRDLAVAEGASIGWAFRKGSPELETLVNEFLGPRRKGTLFGNIMIKRYLKANTWVRNPLESEDRKRVERYRPIFEKYGEQYDVDWVLIMAQAYQESKLDQSVRSSAGAVGLMQIKPSTAADPNVGINDISTPDANVHAGVKYHRFLRDRYFSQEGIDRLNQGLLALAAYNAGPARIRRLREEAAERGLDGNVWFRNLEELAPRQTVEYVGNIFQYYLAYRSHLDRVERLGTAGDG